MRIQKFVEEYCAQSSLHGLRYLTLDGSHWIKKLLWGLIVVMSLIFWIYLSIVLLKRFSKTPTITAVESTNYPTSAIAFPSVTVCNQDIVYQPQTTNVSDILLKRGYNLSMIYQFYDTLLTASIHPLKKPSKMVLAMHELLEKIGYTFKHVVKSLAQPCEQMLAKCWWRSQLVSCQQAFRNVLSLHGFCCRFELNYLRNNSLSAFPISPAGFDKFGGLRVEINSSSYKEKFAPAKVFVSDPNRGLTISDDPEMVVSGVELNIALEPFYIESSEEVKSLDLTSRQCLLKDGIEMDSSYYSHEVKSYDGCVNFGYHREIVDNCHCSLFYMNESDPRELWSRYPECMTKNHPCLVEHAGDKLSRVLGNISEKFKCYAACDEVDYEYTIDYARRKLKIHEMNGGHSIVHVFLRERTCFKYRREVLFSWDQLLASLGGTFGLCLGGSMVSIVELVCLLVDVIRASVGRWLVARMVFARTIDIAPPPPAKNKDPAPHEGKLFYPASEFFGGRY